MNDTLEKIILNEFLDGIDPLCFDLVSDFSLATYGLVFLKNELLLNHRSNIIEFGSGLSTLFMALIIKKYHLNAQITTVESGIEWVALLMEKIDQLELDDFVKVIHAPLLMNEQHGYWYDTEVLNKEIAKTALFDMVVIDGPPAFRPEIAKSRFGAIPFVSELLADSCFILLDDANRQAEQEVIHAWNIQFNFDFKIYNNRFAVHRRGSCRHSDPNIVNSLLTRL